MGKLMKETAQYRDPRKSSKSLETWIGKMFRDYQPYPDQARREPLQAEGVLGDFWDNRVKKGGGGERNVEQGGLKPDYYLATTTRRPSLRICTH